MFSLGNNRHEWAKAIIKQVKDQDIDHVILAARWSGHYNNLNKTSAKAIDRFNTYLINTIYALQDAGAVVWIFREVPRHSISVPKLLIKREVFGTNITQYICSKEKLIKQNKNFDAMLSKLELAGVKVLDASDLLYNKDKRYYNIEYNGKAFYYDNQHLSKYGAEELYGTFTPVFQTYLKN
ncbi:SGNH hydrolase domain-containing protein [Tamlana sp. 2_MG-2023]|uniref:SGNH hydrolase domain-containing protein n=1 Tax=unclassified Tamlana TaxID=2614803 RepID=UPI0026E3C8D7|nr:MULTISPECIES: SGNH hydrolase domain-containing protein [unclassified Tamlana]MDO6760244.1 SGNH hydrolase domain-containing protein [Tamlana sp. 2_MG-2023]MDO6790058.1 SGNH hydrolase domain-containing protein [Tamlana sp. 1_MG-2023]